MICECECECLSVATTLLNNETKSMAGFHAVELSALVIAACFDDKPHTEFGEMLFRNGTKKTIINTSNNKYESLRIPRDKIIRNIKKMFQANSTDLE